MASESIWQGCQITPLSVALVAQLASGKVEGERQTQDLSQCEVFIFILYQAALDHALAFQNGFAHWLDVARRTRVCRSTHVPAALPWGCPTKGSAGSLAPAQLLQLRVTMHTLTKY